MMDFVDANKLLVENMHGPRQKHSIVTAKLEIDNEICYNKDRVNTIAILNTDLSLANDTVDHQLFKSICQTENSTQKSKDLKGKKCQAFSVLYLRQTHRN